MRRGGVDDEVLIASRSYVPSKPFTVSRSLCESPDWELLWFDVPEVNKTWDNHCWSRVEYNGSRRALRFYVKKGFAPLGFSAGYKNEINKPSLPLTHPCFKKLFSPCDDIVQPKLLEMFTDVPGLKTEGREPTAYGALYKRSETKSGIERHGMVNCMVDMDQQVIGKVACDKNGVPQLQIIGPDKKVQPNVDEAWRKMVGQPFECDAIIKLSSARRASHRYSLKFGLIMVRVRRTTERGPEMFPDDGYEPGDEEEEERHASRVRDDEVGLEAADELSSEAPLGGGGGGGGGGEYGEGDETDPLGAPVPPPKRGGGNFARGNQRPVAAAEDEQEGGGGYQDGQSGGGGGGGGDGDAESTEAPLDGAGGEGGEGDLATAGTEGGQDGDVPVETGDGGDQPLEATGDEQGGDYGGGDGTQATDEVPPEEQPADE